MKRGTIVLIVTGVVLFMMISWVISARNKMVTMDEGVKKSWQDVEVVYQRRMDLIPNLVNTVQGYADFEKSTLTAVVDARASATQVKVDPSKLDEASIKKFEEVQNQLSGALSRLLVTVERYPDLKANQNFLALQTELEGTENRIANERRKYNDAVVEFNSYIRRFPQNMLVGFAGVAAHGYFESAPGSEKAPEVKFNTK